MTLPADKRDEAQQIADRAARRLLNEREQPCDYCGGTRWVRAISGSGDVPCPACNASEGAS